MAEEKTGKIQSLQEVAQELSSAIRSGDYRNVQTILDSFEKNSTADDTMKLLSRTDFDTLQTLQKKANETITTDDIDEYVSISDKIATGLLCGARVVDQSLTGICNHIASILKATQTTTANTVNQINKMIENGKNISDNFFETTYNSYNHTRWFFKTVLSNPSNGEKVQTSKKHIRDKYGHLLFIYNHENKEFDYNDALTNYLMPLVIEKLQNKKRPTSASEKDADKLIEKEKEAVELYKKERTKSSPAVLTTQEIQEGQYRILEDQQVAIIESNIQPDIQLEDQQVAIIESDTRTNNNKRGRDSNDSNEENQPSKKIRSSNEILYFVPRTVLIREILHERKRKRKRNESPNGGPNGGKPRRKTRRKISRNKKAKTKKRKVNKKTKKRKMKTKVNRKKSKRRRNKK